MTAQKSTVILECRHAITFSNPLPVLGDTIYCFRCENFHTVVKTTPDYHVSCLDCRYSRYTGQALITATTAADRHSRKYRDHTVILNNGKVVLDIREPRNVAEPSLDDAPPF